MKLYLSGELTAIGGTTTLTHLIRGAIPNVRPDVPNIGDSNLPNISDLPSADYSFNMIDNPGPLSALPSNPTQNFAGRKYNEVVLDHDIILIEPVSQEEVEMLLGNGLQESQ